MLIIQKNRKKTIQKLFKLNLEDRKDLMAAKRKLAKKDGVEILRNADILVEYRKLIKTGKIKENLELEKILRKRAIRTMSGIAPVAVLTKPYSCPGKCVYCPTEKNVPKSYLSNEPAVMRAIRCGYDPYKQVQLRLRALEANGHQPTKIELIVIGGTWSVLPAKYKYWYIVNCFVAANNYKFLTLSSGKQTDKILISKYTIADLKKLLIKEQGKNEKAKYRIIGITLETRPDYINEQELSEMRELGCTRVEVGVQAIDDKILKLNKRGHDVKEIARATSLLRQFGFKITYHIMPALPGSTAVKDLKMFKQLFTDKRFQPDQIKFYPTVVTKGSLLYRWWKQGKYKPYSNKTLQTLIAKCKYIVPTYVRIIRLIRDIPGESIIAGNKITNLRQIMQDRGVKCKCIRCREARDKKFTMNSLKLRVVKYKASEGKEYFISFESKDKKTLFGFCRLRLPNNIVGAEETLLLHSRMANVLKEAAFIRELHVYGELASSGSDKKVQHIGLGKRLMLEAEDIAQKNGFKKMVVISGVGVRGYYKKLGYKLQDSYMVKKIVQLR